MTLPLTPRIITRRWSMSLIWLIIAAICLVFAFLPWFLVMHARPSITPLLLLFVFGWSACPLLLALYLMFNALCRIQISCSTGTLNYHMRLLGLGRTKTFSIDRAILVRQWYHGKHGKVPCDVLFIRSGRTTYRLADEVTCNDLRTLLHWIGSTAEVKTADATHHQPIGG